MLMLKNINLFFIILKKIIFFLIIKFVKIKINKKINLFCYAYGTEILTFSLKNSIQKLIRNYIQSYVRNNILSLLNNN